MQALRWLLILFFLLPAAAPAEVGVDDERPKVGLVLSGGGARGSAHIGVLKALEEINVPVDYIAGTSMGAIVGGLYASGYSAARIEAFTAEMDWEYALSDRPARPDLTMRSKELEYRFQNRLRIGFNQGGFQLPLGVIQGQHLDKVFREALSHVADVQDFDALRIPFRAIATDLVTGEQVVMSRGSLPDALRASMSVPGVFAPVELEHRLLVDGGLSNNLPVDVVRGMGADIVIAVDISAQMLTREQLDSVLSVTEQMTNFLTRRSTEEQIASLGEGDLLIVPDLGEFSSADFVNAMDVVVKGYEAAIDRQAAMAGLAIGPAAAPPEDLPELEANEYIVHFVELDNDSVLNDEIIRSRLAVEVGSPIDLKELDRSMDRIYSLDVFRSVTYDLVENEAGETGVLVHAPRRDWGPNYLQFGIDLSSDFSGHADFKLAAAYTRNALNALGGELRITGSIGREDEVSFNFYQPIDTRARWFVEQETYASRENYDLWLGDENIAELELKGWGIVFGVGRNFSTTNRLDLQYEYGYAESSVLTGTLPGDHGEQDVGELKLQYVHDSLDSLWFPTSGQQHSLKYLYSSEALGSSNEFQQASARGTISLNLGRNAGVFNYELGYSMDDESEIGRWFRLGGLGRLSGLAPDQLIGRHSALATLAYYHRLNSTQLMPLYAGLTLEAGNVWNQKADIALDDLRYSGSLFLGAESPIGPLYLAVGYNDSHSFATYIYIGNPFRVSRFD